MKKMYIAGIAVLVLVLAAGAAWIVIEQDREGPTITVDDAEKLSWHSGMDKSELLSGVTALDDVDGDVTDSLVVESIKQNMETEDKVFVTYAAKDSSNNVTKITRSVDYKDAAEEDAGEGSDESSAEDAEGNEAQADDEAAEAAADPEAKAAAERDVAIEALPEGAPHFYLKQHYVTLKAGESFDKLSWVEDISDTKDSREHLFRYISIEGDVNTSTPGTYELKYHAIDSDGNPSNVDILTVTVN